MSSSDRNQEVPAPPEPADGKAESGRPAPTEGATPASRTFPPPNLVLAIDTALDACSAALYEVPTDRVLAAESVEMSRGHAEALVPMMDALMRGAGLEFPAIDRVVTTVGPGSFTGLRVGIAAARGIGLVTGKPVVGVSTLAALAAPLIAESETVPTVAAIDAHHDNLYLQMSGAGGRLLVPPRVVHLDEALRVVAIGLVRIVGSGAHLLASSWPLQDVPMPLVVDSRPAPDIAWVARLGAKLAPDKAPPSPLYLRPPDARPQPRVQRR